MPKFGPMTSIPIGDRVPIIQMRNSGREALMMPWA
jgi:hypothetical protein